MLDIHNSSICSVKVEIGFFNSKNVPDVSFLPLENIEPFNKIIKS